MFNNKCFCENCNKIKPINVISNIEKKEYTIGIIQYESYYGECSVCKEKVYSYELTQKNEENKKKEINILQGSLKIEKILNSKLNKDVEIINLNEEDGMEVLKKFLKDKNKRN